MSGLLRISDVVANERPVSTQRQLSSRCWRIRLETSASVHSPDESTTRPLTPLCIQVALWTAIQGCWVLLLHEIPEPTTWSASNAWKLPIVCWRRLTQDMLAPQRCHHKLHHYKTSVSCSLGGHIKHSALVRPAALAAVHSSTIRLRLRNPMLYSGK